MTKIVAQQTEAEDLKSIYVADIPIASPEDGLQ
jgi:hypothetical protein